MLPAFFKKDNLFTGIIIGILLPTFFYFALYLIDYVVFETMNAHIVAKPQYMVLLSLVANLFPIKYYFVNKKNDQTGRGILLITCVFGLLYFPLFA